MIKCCYTLCTAAELKWSGNGDGSKLEVEIVRDQVTFFIKKQPETAERRRLTPHVGCKKY